MAVAQNRMETPGPAGPGWVARLVGAKTHFQTRRAIWGYVFALPWVLGLIIFWGGPILASFYFSFTDYEVIGAPDWVGLDNFIRAFTKDDLFWTSMGRTFTFTAFYVPAAIIGALFLAILLNQKLLGTNVFRTVFFVPHLIPAVALADCMPIVGRRAALYRVKPDSQLQITENHRLRRVPVSGTR